MGFIADFELIGLIRRGNHGDWWEAVAPARLGLARNTVAVKALWNDASDEDFDRMVRELRLMSDLRDPHLAELIEAGESDGRLYLVRRHYPDGTLDDVEPLDPRTVPALIAAARGAHALHRQGISHRDIKPANVLITPEGGLLAELGLAQRMSAGETTGIGPVGAIDYVSPEIVAGERGSAASDIWALGVTIHRAVTGLSIYGNAVVNDVLAGYRRALAGDWELDPALPSALVPIVQRCLEPDPANRYNDAEDLAGALSAANVTVT